jgi:hypothetical protein
MAMGRADTRCPLYNLLGHTVAAYKERPAECFWRNLDSSPIVPFQAPICDTQSHNSTGDPHMTEPTYEELKAKIAALEAKQQGGSISFKVSDKGGVSVYGLGRFPVTLYYEQWTRLLDKAQELREFLDENKSKLKLKE